MSLRIAHVISSPEGMGGAEHVLAQLVRHGTDRQWTHLVLQLFAAEPSDGKLRDEVAPAPLVTFPCAGPRAVPSMRWELARRLRDFDPHIVHVHLFHASLVVASLPRRGRAARVLTHHHGAVLRREGRAVSHRLDRLAVRRYDRVVAVSSAVQRFVVNELGLDRARTTVIRNGFAGHPLPRRPHADPTIVSVARLRPEKAHDVLLRAFHDVRREVPAARLMLVGDGPQRAELELLVDDLVLRPSVTFHGSVEDVWPHLAGADVFCLASRNEPLGISILEAMAAGLPVVATSSGGIPELVTDGVHGLLVDVDDAPALAERLVALLTDPPRAGAMGRAGHEKASSMTMDAMLDNYADLYAELAPQERR